MTLKDLPKKKAIILSTSKDLFWKHGFRRISVEEICRESKVSKVTFYKYFDNKNILLKSIMETLMKEGIEKYYEIHALDIPYKEKVEKLVEMKMEGTKDVSKEFFEDFHKHGDPELIKYFLEERRKFMNQIIADYQEAQKNGEIRKDLNPMFIIFFTEKMYEWVNDESLLKMYPDPQSLIMELTRFFFYGIMPRDNIIEE